MVLRWFNDSTDLRLFASVAHFSIATAYRYLHEGIDVIATQAPDLHHVPAQARGGQRDLLGQLGRPLASP